MTESDFLNELNKVRSHLDAALGDTDPPGDPAHDWKDEHPLHWCCWRLSTLISARARELRAKDPRP